MFLGVCPPGLINSFLWFSSLLLLLSASSSLIGTDALEDAIEGDWNLKSAAIDGELVGVLRDEWTMRWTRGVLVLSAAGFELLLLVKAAITLRLQFSSRQTALTSSRPLHSDGVLGSGGFPLSNAKWPKISPPSWLLYPLMTAAKSEICVDHMISNDWSILFL